MSTTDHDGQIPARWMATYDELKAFIAENHRHPAESEGGRAGTLARWIVSQRRIKRGTRAGTLTASAIALLEALDGWSWDREQGWTDTYEQFKSFVLHNGRYPHRQTGNDAEEMLAKWHYRNLARRRGQRGSRLTQQQATLLEALPGWSWAPTADARWSSNLSQLRAFIAENGRYPSAKSKDPATKKLANWVERHRGQIRAGTLSLPRQEELETLPGWTLDPVAQRWQESYDDLAAFATHHDRLPSKWSADHTEAKLAQWVTTQRKAIAGRGNYAPLTAAQIASLETVPGWMVDPRGERWQHNYEEFRSFVDAHHRNPAQHATNRTEVKLAQWRTRQRAAKAGTGHYRPLTAAQISLLEQVLGWSWGYDHNQSPAAPKRGHK